MSVGEKTVRKLPPTMKWKNMALITLCTFAYDCILRTPAAVTKGCEDSTQWNEGGYVRIIIRQLLESLENIWYIFIRQIYLQHLSIMLFIYLQGHKHEYCNACMFTKIYGTSMQTMQNCRLLSGETLDCYLKIHSSGVCQKQLKQSWILKG